MAYESMRRAASTACGMRETSRSQARPRGLRPARTAAATRAEEVEARARAAAAPREHTHVESVAATAWGPDAVDAAERPRERAGLRETGRAAAAPRAPRERAGAHGQADGRAQSSPVRHRRDGEATTKPHTTTPPSETTPHDEKNTTKKPRRSSTSTAAKNNRSARRRSSSSAGRRRAFYFVRTSPRGA